MLDFKTQRTQAGQMGLNQVFALFFAIPDNALVTGLLCLRTGTAWFEWLSVRANWEFVVLTRHHYKNR